MQKFKNENNEDKNKKQTIIIDRGLTQSGLKIHGINPIFLIEKILREKIQDSNYWHITASKLNFYQLIDECVENVNLIGTYLNNSKTKISKFITLLFRLLQFKIIDFEIIKWIIIGDHGFKYLTVLFMLYARLIWENSIEIWKVFELKFNDFRKIRIINENGIIVITHIDEIVDSLLENDKFIDMTLPRLVNRWILEDKMELQERESDLMDEFEDEINQDDNEV